MYEVVASVVIIFGIAVIGIWTITVIKAVSDKFNGNQNDEC